MHRVGAARNATLYQGVSIPQQRLRKCQFFLFHFLPEVEEIISLQGFALGA